MASPSPVRLLCLPYAGASALVYARWKRRLPAWIEVLPIELPGRGRLMQEPLQTNMASLVSALVPRLPELRERPFALFGHSLGALVAFEIAHYLQSNFLGTPLVVFASGAHAPSQRDGLSLAVPESDAELRAELERLGGTPAQLLADPEIMALTLPVLRADFAVARRYTSDHRRRIGCPIHVLAGSADETTEATLVGWREHTRGAFFRDLLPGGHFFIHEQEAELLRLVQLRLQLLAGQERFPEQRPPI